MSFPSTPKSRPRKSAVALQGDFDYKNYEIPPKVIYNLMTQRPKSSHLTRPVTRFKTSSKPKESRVGPGTYNPVHTKDSNSFQFSRVERFSNSVVDASFILKKNNSKVAKQPKSIDYLNKTGKIFETDKKRLKFNFRAELAKEVKNQIYQSKVETQAKATREKFRKLDFRLRLSEIAEIKKTWIVLELAFAAAYWVSRAMNSLKELKTRACRKFRIFRFCVRIVGKFLRIRVKVKYYKGMRVNFRQIIRIYLTSYVKLWMAQRKKRLRNIFAKTVENGAGSIMIMNLIRAWKHKFEFVRRMLNGAIFYKVSLYRSLIQRWNRAEYEMNNESPSKPARRHRRALTIHGLKDNQDIEGILLIPIEVKLHYLRKFIREKMIGYIKKYRKFKLDFKNVHRQNKKNRWILENNIMLDYPNPPAKVNVYEEFTIGKIKSIISYSINDQKNWAAIVQSEQNKTIKQYKRRISEVLTQEHIPIN